MSNPKSVAPHWSSGASFVFVASGLAIGLGNLWRFPFLAGQYGGGAFILVYVAAVAMFGLPIIIAELIIGRRGGGTPGQAIRNLGSKAPLYPLWSIIGWLSLFIPFIGIAYYSVIAGWVVDYTFNFIASGGFPAGDAASHQARFDSMLASPTRVVAGHLIFMTLVAIVVARGVNEGLEKISKILMPVLFILMISLAIYASATGAFHEAAAFLFKPDFSKLTGEGVAAAAGQAFFSLGIGLGALMTFGAYLPGNVSIVRVAAAVAIADTSISLIAGLAIFPITFALGIDPASGPGLVFVSMPAAFAGMPGGYFIGSAFFVLLFIAAYTTGIATIEPVVAWLVRKGMNRIAATMAAAAAAWVVGLGAAFSFNIWSDVRLLNWLPPFVGKSIFDILDYSISTIFLPLNGLLIALFVGWVLSSSVTRDELRVSEAVHRAWRFAIRFIAPLCVVLGIWL